MDYSIFQPFGASRRYVSTYHVSVAIQEDNDPQQAFICRPAARDQVHCITFTIIDRKYNDQHIVLLAGVIRIGKDQKQSLPIVDLAIIRELKLTIERGNTQKRQQKWQVF
jgi:hypothetical protein